MINEFLALSVLPFLPILPFRRHVRLCYFPSLTDLLPYLFYHFTNFSNGAPYLCYHFAPFRLFRFTIFVLLPLLPTLLFYVYFRSRHFAGRGAPIGSDSHIRLRYPAMGKPKGWDPSGLGR